MITRIYDKYVFNEAQNQDFIVFEIDNGSWYLFSRSRARELENIFSDQLVGVEIEDTLIDTGAGRSVSGLDFSRQLYLHDIRLEEGIFEARLSNGETLALSPIEVRTLVSR